MIIRASFWDGWKQFGLAKIYRNEIYPKALEAVKPHIEPLPVEEVVLVDLFGGDGEFVDLLHAKVLPRSRRREMHVIDGNKTSLSRARERSKKKNPKRFVVHPAIDLTQTDNIFGDMHNQPNIVTAIGGLCDGVVTRDQGLKIAEQVYAGLQNEGTFVVTGYSPAVMNANDFEDIGFTVQQKAVPENAVTFKSPYQMYVLTK